MKEVRFVRVINEALREEMARDERVCLIGEDIGRGEGSWSATRGLLQEFGPDRVIDTSIVESTIVGIALGMAMSGLRPVAEIMFMDFSALCVDPIVNGIAKERYRFAGEFEAPVTIRMPAGAAGGAGFGLAHATVIVNKSMKETTIKSLHCFIPCLLYRLVLQILNTNKKSPSHILGLEFSPNW